MIRSNKRGSLSSTSRTPGSQEGTSGGRSIETRHPVKAAAANIADIEKHTLFGWLGVPALMLATLLVTVAPARADHLHGHSVNAGDAQKAASFAAGTALGTALGTAFAGRSADAVTDGASVSQSHDAGLYLDPEVALGNGGLRAYSLDKREKNAALLPGLAGIATHIHREQRMTTAEGQGFSYSLADAMADALWRKQVVDMLYRDPDVGTAN